MFGDPLINTKKWKECTIGELATDVRYGTSKPSVDGGKYPYLRMNNLTNNGELDLTDLKYIDVSEYSIMAEPVIPDSRATLIPVARAIYSIV